MASSRQYQLYELDEAEKLYVSAAAFVSRHPTGANYLTVEFAGLMAMTQDLTNLFGLTLPEPSKERAYDESDNSLSRQAAFDAS